MNNYTISKVSKNRFMCCLVSVLVQWQLCRKFCASFSLGRCKESVNIQCEAKWITTPQQRLSNIEPFLSLNKLCWIGSEGNFCLFNCFSFRVSPTQFCWLFDNLIQWFLIILAHFSYLSKFQPLSYLSSYVFSYFFFKSDKFSLYFLYSLGAMENVPEAIHRRQLTLLLRTVISCQ